jgi:hypothetical protein
MKIVLDTNVLVSGLLQPFGPSGQIVRLVASGDLLPARWAGFDFLRVLAPHHPAAWASASSVALI